MRLSQPELDTIRQTIKRHFGQNSAIWLFGSRTDDQRLGGDVDLYIETDNPELMKELHCKINLEEAVDLHFDLILARPGDDRLIARIAKTRGVRL